MVIVRAWHATATTEGADAYHEHFADSVLPELQRIDGYQGAYLLRRGHDSQVELQVLTLWDSLELLAPDNGGRKRAVSCGNASEQRLVRG